MDRFGKICVDREVPELARAADIVRAGRGIAAVIERAVYEIERVVAGLLFVGWGLACAALAAGGGQAGWLAVALLGAANASLIRLMARHAPEVLLSDRKDDGDSLEDIPDGFARVAILALSLTVFLPAVAVGFRWYADAALRRLDERRRRADTVASDPRWPALRRLFAAIERQNDIAAEGIATDELSAILAPLLDEARTNTYLRPLGRAHRPLSPAFHHDLERLESATAKLGLEKDRLRDRVV